MDLRDILRLFYLPRKIAIQDCVDTGTLMNLLDGQTYDLPIDCALRNYLSTERELFFPETSTVRDSIVNNGLTVKVKLSLRGNVSDKLKINIYIPHPTYGNIPVDNYEIVIYRNNLTVDFSQIIELYNAIDGEAHLYGFKFELVPEGNLELTSRSILIKA